MAKLATSLLAGLIFGLGLVISGMINPAKVQNFLDFAGAWDPSLALVMGAALVVAAIGYRLAIGRTRPLFASRFHLPSLTRIDARLLCGAAIFGFGWGLSGFCPGPAIAATTLGLSEALAFTAAMLAGMAGWRWIVR